MFAVIEFFVPLSHALNKKPHDKVKSVTLYRNSKAARQYLVSLFF